ncbi:MAG: VOC family protein [Pseudomonadota bacterium]
MSQNINATLGHVHLRVTDLERAVAFYQDVLGLDVMVRYGTQAAFLSYGGYHHHLGLNTWDSLHGTPASKKAAGLYHSAFLFPDRPALARAYKRVLDAGVVITGAADHGAPTLNSWHRALLPGSAATNVLDPKTS